MLKDCFNIGMHSQAGAWERVKNIITTMGIISDRVYNQDKGKDYFSVSMHSQAGAWERGKRRVYRC